MTTDITELALITKIKNQLRNFDTIVLKEDEALALVEALEKAQRANGHLREQSAEWERKAISNFEDCAEMSARIEDLESQRKLAFTASNRWADKFREAEKRYADMDIESAVKDASILELKQQYQRLLESLAVKLPEPFKLTKSSSGLTYHYADEVNEALSAAGIKWEAE